MANETDFLNDALGQIGAAKIVGIDDQSINANHCQVFWPPLRKALIRMNNWNFAVWRAELAQDAIPPAFEFAFSYSLPADFVKMIEFNGGGTPLVPAPGFINLYPYISRYVIEGKKLLTNDPQAFVKYLRDINNPDLWDPLFYQIAAAWLTSKLATAITKSEKLAMSKMEEVMKILLPMGINVDGQEGTELPDRIDTLIRNR